MALMCMDSAGFAPPFVASGALIKNFQDFIVSKLSV